MSPAWRETTALYAAVALGSALGGTARWLAGEALHDWAGSGFPWGTLFVNVTGSFLIGIYAALAGPDGRLLASPRQRQFVMTGLCGGYTTFSIFSLETVRLVEAGRPALATLAVGVSVVLWLVAVWLGWTLATRINRLRR
ncbi:fluoride efflux transporter CrcB [Elioraea sp.]|uniref:fluoride efflux transporter CrcB n=1 Tax=Elioraea sp. TaxID=2185103 RepID=UPI003F7253BC